MLVLDTSIVMAWCFPDETSAFADLALEHLRTSRAFVPQLWPLEVANVLLVAERRQRLQPWQSSAFVSLLTSFPIELEQRSPADLIPDVLALARIGELTAYDAAYLDVALRLALPLATLDAKQIAAAQVAGVPLFAP